MHVTTLDENDKTHTHEHKKSATESQLFYASPHISESKRQVAERLKKETRKNPTSAPRHCNHVVQWRGA